MEKLREAIRPTDVLLALAASSLGIWLMVENVNYTGTATRIDTHTWLVIPVWLVATVPLLFRRVNTIAVILVAAAAMAVHVAAFGWMVRCGAGLPLAFVLAYSAGRLVGNRTQSFVALVLTIGVQALVLVRDSAAGLGILPVTAVIGLAAWGIGLLVRTLLARRSGSTTSPTPVGASA